MRHFLIFDEEREPGLKEFRSYVLEAQSLSLCGGVRLNVLDTSATVWPIVPAPDDSRQCTWNSQWNGWQGKLEYSETTCPSAT
jgi:hypothetical protein